MTNGSATDTHYWQALRFYSGRWRDRHGADMVAMMIDAADNGEDPLGHDGRRSLMWSGLRERFASRPYSWLWVVLILLAAGVFEWSTYRMIQIGLYADAHGTAGDVDPWLWPVVLAASFLFLTGVTTLIVSMLHIPPFPRHAAMPARWAWTAWLALAGWLLFPLIGSVLAVVSLVAGISLYRRTHKNQYRVLAGLSGAAVAITALLFLPQISILVQENLIQ